MRTPIIAGNWKMNLLREPAGSLARKIVEQELGNAVEVVLCPTFTALHAVADAIGESKVALGAQNCYHEENGAYTGEISPQMLLDSGCSWVIIGHSERRHILGETNQLLAKKLAYARECGLKVMFCVGETLEERESGKTFEVLDQQFNEGFTAVHEGALTGIVIAYEPVWAIGTGKNATPEQADEAHAYLRGLMEQRFGKNAAGSMRIQYGGSVKPDNAADLLGQPHVDGALVGGASLEADSFVTIVGHAAG